MDSSRVRLPVGALLCNDLVLVVYTVVPLSPSGSFHFLDESFAEIFAES